MMWVTKMNTTLTIIGLWQLALLAGRGEQQTRDHPQLQNKHRQPKSSDSRDHDDITINSKAVHNKLILNILSETEELSTSVNVYVQTLTELLSMIEFC